MSHQKDKPNPDSEEHRELETLRRHWAAGERSEPPAMLDQAVLNAARRALERGAKRPGRRWLGALATAGVVVLAVTLVVRQGPREPGGATAPSREERQLKLQRPAARTMEEPSAEALSSRRETDSAATAADEAQAEKAPEGELHLEATSKARPLPPDEWIRRLRALKAQGDTDRLSVELEAFVRAYPDYELPAELKPGSP